MNVIYINFYVDSGIYYITTDNIGNSQMHVKQLNMFSDEELYTLILFCNEVKLFSDRNLISTLNEEMVRRRKSKIDKIKERLC